MEKPEIRLAVVGAGSWARRIHYPTLQHLRERPGNDYTLTLHGVCSLDIEASRELASEYGFTRVYANLGELSSDPSVDAVAIIVPSHQLLEVIRSLQGLRAPVLMEKPPGGSPAEAEAIARLLHVPHVVAFNRRYAPMNARFKELVEAMEHRFFAEGRLYRHGRSEPGFVRETGVHLLSLMTWCFGPIASARTTRLPNPQAPTHNWIVEVLFESGMPGRLHIFPCSGMHAEQIEVHSPMQSLVLEGPEIHVPRGRIHVHKKRPGAGSVQVRHEAGFRIIPGPVESSTILDGPGISPLITCGFVPEYEEFLSLAIGKSISRSTVEGAIEMMRLAEAIEAGVDYRRS